MASRLPYNFIFISMKELCKGLDRDGVRQLRPLDYTRSPLEDVLNLCLFN